MAHKKAREQCYMQRWMGRLLITNTLTTANMAKVNKCRDKVLCIKQFNVLLDILCLSVSFSVKTDCCTCFKMPQIIGDSTFVSSNKRWMGSSSGQEKLFLQVIQISLCDKRMVERNIGGVCSSKNHCWWGFNWLSICIYKYMYIHYGILNRLCWNR